MERHLFLATCSPVLQASCSRCPCGLWGCSIFCQDQVVFPVAIRACWGAAGMPAFWGQGKPYLQYGCTSTAVGLGHGDLTGAPEKGSNPVGVIHWYGKKWEPQYWGAELGGGVCPSVSVGPMAFLCPHRVRLMAH